MDAFNKTNLRNIQERFAEKTGVAPGHRRRRPVRTAVVVAAVMACCLATTAFAVGLFSSLDGDELALSAAYEGEGVVAIRVENRSDKTLRFQPQLKLKRWSADGEVVPLSDRVVFRGTEFAPHTDGTMTIDLSGAYDMEQLEQPLAEHDWYYFVLTNNSFLFGQDWMCSVSFAPPVVTGQAEPAPLSPAQADPALTAQITEELRPYFERYASDPAEKRAQTEEYMASVQGLLERLDLSLVRPVSPLELTLAHADGSVVFDEAVPADRQRQLVGLHRYCTDGYGKLIGMSPEDRAMVVGAYLPQRPGELDGGVEVPLLYVLTFEKSAITAPQDYTFLRGQLVTFAQMEPCKLYEDEAYVCYDVTEWFYTELRAHVESMVSQRSDVCFDEQGWERVQRIYHYYRENLGALLGYRADLAQAAAGD